MSKIDWEKENLRSKRYVSKRKLQLEWNMKNVKTRKEKEKTNDEEELIEEENEIETAQGLDDFAYDHNSIFYEDYNEERGFSHLENKEFDRESALNVIASVFLYNNFSKSLAQDVFSLSKLINEFGSITVTEVFKRIESWSNHENRCYTVCCSCPNLLSESKKCRNRSCIRYGKSQANLAGSMKVLTFSIKNQLKGILESGNFDFELLNRNTNQPSLSKRLSRTPKYLERLRKAEAQNPDITTLFISINMDGFRRKGLSRGEFWPLYVAVNDLSNGKSGFSEYRPEVVMLSSMIQSPKQLEKGDFNSAFERLRIEIGETQRNPIEVTINGSLHKIRLEIYQTVLDMDASRKIHGIPIWQAYQSCSRCKINGQRIETKKGSKMAWIPEENVECYNDSDVPDKLNTTCLPPPWKEGYDSLHLICEGTSKDVMKEILSSGSKYKTKIKNGIKSIWAESLTTAKNPKGTSSTNLLDPIQLSTRTGTEIQQLFNIAVPSLIMCHDKAEMWIFCLYMQWMVTRLIVDPHLSHAHCNSIRFIAPVLRTVIGQHFPEFCTMKQHFVIDHMIQTLEYDGSPILSSAAPFERLNQVLGRGTGSNTTRTVMNMSRRFIALQKAVSHCSAAIGKKNCPVSFPKTMKAVDEDSLSYVMNPDDSSLSQNEKNYLLTIKSVIENFRVSIRDNSRVFATRKSCENAVQKNCYVYYVDNDGKQMYGSIERLFQLDGEDAAMLQRFKTISAFEQLRSFTRGQSTFQKVFECCEKSNLYFKQVIGFEYDIIVVKRILGYCSVLEFKSRSFVSRC